MSSSRAHLDNLSGGARDPREINWLAIFEWKDGAFPTFAGRYFAGTPTQAEVDAETGFCLWAHGEGNELAAPTRIVPLQRSDASRQTALGSTGEQFAFEDASAFGAYVQRCFEVGDLALRTEARLVFAYLEVEPGTALSADYWSSWARTITSKVFEVDGLAPERPLLPAIACGFARENANGPLLPELAVRECLSSAMGRGRSSVCYGFWSRTVDPAPTFGSYVQDEVQGPIPVHFWRTFDGPAGSPIPQGAPASVLSTLPLITIDEHAEGDDDPTVLALQPVPWNPVAVPPPDSVTLPTDLPTQCGVDTAAIFTLAQAECVKSGEMVIRRLPAGSTTTARDLGTHLEGPNTLRGHSSFAGRYLKPHFSGLTPEEVMRLFIAGMSVCSIWQLGRTFLDGFDEGVEAFTEAEKVGQPPYTPIYFAVDVSVGEPPDPPPDPPSPPLAEVVDYFHDVRRAYRHYLSHGGTTPYFIGAYAAANVLEELYRDGLASHFWQPWPFNWGPPDPKPANWSDVSSGWRAWPHLNFWQVLLENGRADLRADNAAVGACIGTANLLGVDLNVAWGDPGCWEPV